VLPLLPPSIRAFAISQRGHGSSSRPESGYLAADMARDVAEFLDHFRIRAAILVGHSMGAQVAKRFAIAYPERTLGIVLIGSFALMHQNVPVRELWDSIISALQDPVDRAFVEDFQKSTISLPVPPEFFETVVQESLKVPAYVWRAAFQGFLEEDVATGLDQIRAPALLAWGAGDSLIPQSDQQFLLNAIAGSTLSVYETCGHSPHWESPERFASELVAFCDQRVSLQQ
jgi:pimeloyl-ACP methyl ester carboxylesterase